MLTWYRVPSHLFEMTRRSYQPRWYQWPKILLIITRLTIKIWRGGYDPKQR